MPRDLPAFDVETTPLRRLIDALRGPCPDYDGGCYQHCALDVASRHSTVYTKDEMADRLEAWAKERGL